MKYSRRFQGLTPGSKAAKREAAGARRAHEEFLKKQERAKRSVLRDEDVARAAHNVRAHNHHALEHEMDMTVFVTRAGLTLNKLKEASEALKEIKRGVVEDPVTQKKRPMTVAECKRKARFALKRIAKMQME